MAMNTSSSEFRLAVLIDAENITPKPFKAMMEEIAQYGSPTIKRIYGDFTTDQHKGWKEVLHEHAITPMQQYRYSNGKNATDSAMIIDAMDMLYGGLVDGFFIVSSDSDFTKLAKRLREGGKRVFGMGEKKTPRPFITACEKFIYIEVLQPSTSSEEVSAIGGKALQKAKATKAQDGVSQKKEAMEPERTLSKPLQQMDAELEDGIRSLVGNLADDSGWVFMGTLGNVIQQNRPDFDPRNFGFKKLTDLIATISGLEVVARATGPGKVQHHYVRLKA
jgi:uncharacterized LabA/DUF88 family protein